jgi:integrase
MAGNRAKIDRRLMAAPGAAKPSEGDGVVVFRDGWGEVVRRYDLMTLALPVDVTYVLADAFRHHHVASKPLTQRACWQSLQSFARFAREDTGIQSTHDLNTATIGRYIVWLDQQTTLAGTPRSLSARANLLSYLRQLVNWTKWLHPSRLPQRIDFPFRAYPDRNNQQQLRRRLSEDQLKAILRACYEDIDAAWERFDLGQQILRRDTVPAGVSADLYRLIRDLAQLNDGIIPAQLTIGGHRFSRSVITRHGGLRTLAGYLHLTGETLLPFYVALAIQTAANPQPLMLFRRDCQRPHPLDEFRVIIDWDKGRAGDKLKRVQRRSFDRRRRYAAPNLIDKLLAMTAPLVAQASLRDRERLFLVKSEKTHTVAPIALSTITHAVAGFIARSNERIAIWNRAAPERPRALLPDFAAMLLRGSVATEHYQASGGDIVHVQQILNHTSVTTTEAYVKGPRTEQLRRDIVARLQRLMVGWIMGEADTPGTPQDTVAPGLAARATAPFGHDCLNPLAGTAPGTRAGQTCPHLGGCLRCPGLVIPIDAPHLARILRAKEAFERAREQLDPVRWELIYAPSYRILMRDILPDFPDALHVPAAVLAKVLPRLPALE